MSRVPCSFSSCLCFGQPPATQSLLGNAGQIRLDVENRRSVQHVHPTNVKICTFAPEQFYSRHANGIGPVGRAWQRPRAADYQMVACLATESLVNDQIPKAQSDEKSPQ